MPRHWVVTYTIGEGGCPTFQSRDLRSSPLCLRVSGAVAPSASFDVMRMISSAVMGTFYLDPQDVKFLPRGIARHCLRQPAPQYDGSQKGYGS
jgi:hypothetical protein